jgi:hypothetical protein
MDPRSVDDTAVAFLKAAMAVAVWLTAVGILLQTQLHAFGRMLRTTDGEHFKG